MFRSVDRILSRSFNKQINLKTLGKVNTVNTVFVNVESYKKTLIFGQLHAECIDMVKYLYS